VVSEIAGAIPKEFNIALSETATISAGKKHRHHVDLFLEPTDPSTRDVVAFDDRIAWLVKELRNRFPQVANVPLVDRVPNVSFAREALQIGGWEGEALVEHGWIGKTDWRRFLHRNYRDLGDVVDINTVVISADTTRRLLRYTFPRHGAMTFVILGRDEPQAMLAMTTAIKSAKLNILSSLIKRGGRRLPGYATFIAVCEPEPALGITRNLAAAFVTGKEREIETTLHGSEYRDRFRFSVKVSPPRLANEVVYVRAPGGPHQNDTPRRNSATSIHAATISPFWGKLMTDQVDNDLCFVLMPFSPLKLSEIYEQYVRPPIEQLGLRCLRADDISKSTKIMQDIWEHINRARVVVAEMTCRNANVFYELGMAHVLGKDVILLSQSTADVPFDLAGVRHIRYEDSPAGYSRLSDQVRRFVGALSGKG
jgi:hypothetical protein